MNELEGIFKDVIYENDRWIIEYGKIKGDFKKYMEEKDYKTFCFITPYNPSNIIIDDSSNAVRLKKLDKRLKKWKHKEALSRHTKSDYPPERGYIIFDINEDDAKELQRDFEQVAILYGNRKECDFLWLKV